jgi:hypothetical protein
LQCWTVATLPNSEKSDVNAPHRIIAPWGLKQVVPLLKTHRVQLTEPGMAPAFSLNLHAVPLGASEFGVAMRDYPIVFLRRARDGVHQAVAILGMKEGENLYVMPDGRWDRRTYIPAYIRRYPFHVEVTGAERTICVDPDAVADDGERLFDEAGAPLQHWIVFERLLNEYEDELARAHRLGDKLHALGVLAPFSLHADLSSGFSLSLDGMFRVDRGRLGALKAAALRELIGSGAMESVYAHLLSQENFRRLLSRRGFFAKRPAS